MLLSRAAHTQRRQSSPKVTCSSSSASAVKLDTTLFVSRNASQIPVPSAPHHGSLKKCTKDCTFFQTVCCLILKTDTTRALMKYLGRPHRRKTDHQPSKRLKQDLIASHRRTSKNADMTLQCEECELWRLVSSKTKLTKQQLEEALADSVFTCGFALEDLQVEGFNNVYTRPLNCYDHIEKQYYSAGYTPICVYCGEDCPLYHSSSTNYPQCQECNNKEPIKK